MELLDVVMLLTVTSTVLADNCQYRRYVSASSTTDLIHHNTTLRYPNLGMAKDACDALNEVCKGVNLRTVDQLRSFVLTSSGEVEYTRGSLAWRKLCPGSCYYSIVTNHLQGKRQYSRICPSESNKVHAQIEVWGRWLNWGPCSQSCGQLGEQKRYRQCLARKSNRNCLLRRMETRVCNYARKCPKTLSNVFGVTGTEGFRSYGSTPVYSTCIRTEHGDKRPCGSIPNSVSREYCTQQMKCCYVNDTVFAALGGPRCFAPKHFIRSSGLIQWSVWSPWTVCTASCGGGIRRRNRICAGNVPNRKSCQGSDTEREVCNSGNCPCDDRPCRNGGICRANRQMSRGYTCECTQRFVGRHCDYAEPVLSCGNDSIAVSFDRRLIGDQELIDDRRFIHFQGHESSDCFARLDAQRTHYVLAIPPPIDKSCGSHTLVTGDSYSIRNKVLWKLTDQSASSTVVLLDLTCNYNKRLNMTSSLDFGIQPTVRTLSFKTERIEFHVVMTLYGNVDFSERSRIRTSPTVAEGEILYVSVDLQTISLTNPENEILTLDRCYATDVSQPERSIYEFIVNGCSTNHAFTTVLRNGVSATGQWAFRVFEWTTLSTTSEINIVCKVFVCDNEFEDCQVSCDHIVATSPSSDNSSTKRRGIHDASRVSSASVVNMSAISRRKRRSSTHQRSDENVEIKDFEEFHHMTISKQIRTKRFKTRGFYNTYRDKELTSSDKQINFNPAAKSPIVVNFEDSNVWPIYTLVGITSIALYVSVKLAIEKLFCSRYKVL